MESSEQSVGGGLLVLAGTPIGDVTDIESIVHNGRRSNATLESSPEQTAN